MQAEGQLTRDQAQLEGARINLERYRILSKQNSIARQTYEDQSALVHQFEGTVKLDQGVVESARVNLDYTNIISPVNGTVVSRNVTVGQTVTASFQTPTLFLIATDLTAMEVDTNVTQSDIGGIKDGENASFTVESFPERPFDARVLQIRQAPQTVQNVVPYDVVIGFDRNCVDHLLWRTSTGGRKVAGLVLRDGHPESLILKLGLDDETNSEIFEGDVKLGDKVIIRSSGSR